MYLPEENILTYILVIKHVFFISFLIILIAIEINKKTMYLLNNNWSNLDKIWDI